MTSKSNFINTSILFILGVFLIACNGCKAPEKIEESEKIRKPEVLSQDGTWCWFSDPRSIYRHNGKAEIVTGWVTKDGSIESAILDLESGEKVVQNVSPQLEVDDHANPAFIELANKDVLMLYAKHSDQYIRINRLASSNDTFGPLNKVDPFDEAEQAKFPNNRRVTYANPFALRAEQDRIYCFGRWTGFKPNVCWSDDGGNTFSKSKVFITNYPFDPGNRPYVKYYSDGQSKIHIVMTDGHPRNEPTNSVYYAYYENGAFWKADDTKICNIDEIPFEPLQASIVYQATDETGRAWVYDIAADPEGNPVVLYARYPEETEHIYHYARYNENSWDDHKICDSGQWFPQTQEGKVEREPHYSGGLTIDPMDVNTLFVARERKKVFEIEKMTTTDSGKSWEITPITTNSKYDNVRPIVPRNRRAEDPLMVLWMVNERYVHYTDYQTRIEYYKVR